MHVFNAWLEQTGTINYENDQQLQSGLIGYNTPFLSSTGTRFAVIKRKQFVAKTDETSRHIRDQLKVQFSEEEVYNLSVSGVRVQRGRTTLTYDGTDFRAVLINDFGQKFNRFMPIGIVEVLFERRIPLAY